MSNVKHCWPTPWLEAAMKAGFAHYNEAGEWLFISDKMRDSLSEFAAELQVMERERVIDAVQHLDYGRWSKAEIRDCVQLYGA